MPKHFDYKRYKHTKFLSDLSHINKIDKFKQRLEKAYFAEVTIRRCCVRENVENLIVELNCNLSLVSLLYLAQKGLWGNFKTVAKRKITPECLLSSMGFVREYNDSEILIEELAIYLKDANISIRSISPHSIEEQFGNIINRLAEHYVHLTNNMTSTPQDIYIPVFEEITTNEKDKDKKLNEEKLSIGEYFKYWGLYFDNQQDAVIYDLLNKSIISGDLHMLDH